MVLLRDVEAFIFAAEEGVPTEGKQHRGNVGRKRRIFDFR